MKKYTNKQEYVAFYWDGSNSELLQEWLDQLNAVGEFDVAPSWTVSGKISGCRLSYCCRLHGSRSVNFDHCLDDGYPRWCVFALAGDCFNLSVLDVETFNKFFTEVTE